MRAVTIANPDFIASAAVRIKDDLLPVWRELCMPVSTCRGDQFHWRTEVSMRATDLKTPDVQVDEVAGVDQTLGVARDCQLRAVLSDTRQPLWLAGTSG